MLRSRDFMSDRRLPSPPVTTKVTALVRRTLGSSVALAALLVGCRGVIGVTGASTELPSPQDAGGNDAEAGAGALAFTAEGPVEVAPVVVGTASSEQRISLENRGTASIQLPTVRI